MLSERERERERERGREGGRERVLHDGQNHLFRDDKISGLRNCLREVCMSVEFVCQVCKFSSETEEYMQVLQDTVVLSVLEIKLLAANDTFKFI